MIDFDSYVVPGDKAATLAKFEAEYDAWLLATSGRDAEVEKAIDAVFDSQTDQTKALATPVLVTTVLQKLGKDLGEFSQMKPLVQRILKGSPRFEIGSGRSGGVKRLSQAENAREHGLAEPVQAHTEEQTETPAQTTSKKRNRKPEASGDISA